MSSAIMSSLSHALHEPCRSILRCVSWESLWHFPVLPSAAVYMYSPPCNNPSARPILTFLASRRRFHPDPLAIKCHASAESS
eukprot:scaffold86878_cov66-Phaeocystis_antarctica.AAC.1